MNRRGLEKALFAFCLTVFIIGSLFLLVNMTHVSGGHVEGHCEEDSVSKECVDAEGKKSLEVFSPRYNDAGVWKPINLTVTDSDYLDYEYEVTESLYNVFFQDNIQAGKGMRFEKEGYFLTYDLSGGKMEWRGQNGDPTKTKSIGSTQASSPTNNKSVITYSDAFTNTDVEYSLENTMLKENFILSALPSGGEDYENLVYSGEIEFSPELEIYADGENQTDKSFQTNGSIQLRNTTSNEIFSMPEPIATDANGDTVRLTYDVKPNTGKYQFDLMTPRDFLLNATYPIRIDPSLEINDGQTEVLGGNQEYDWVKVNNNGVIEINDTIGWLTLNATINISVEDGGLIDGGGKGTSTYGGANLTLITDDFYHNGIINLSGNVGVSDGDNNPASGDSGNLTIDTQNTQISGGELYLVGGIGRDGFVSGVDSDQGGDGGNGGKMNILRGNFNLDNATVYAQAGDGGNGANNNPGPPGGNGGQGGLINLTSDVSFYGNYSEINLYGGNGGLGGEGDTRGGAGGDGGISGRLSSNNNIIFDMNETTLNMYGGGGGDGGDASDGNGIRGGDGGNRVSSELKSDKISLINNTFSLYGGDGGDGGNGGGHSSGDASGGDGGLGGNASEIKINSTESNLILKGTNIMSNGGNGGSGGSGDGNDDDAGDGGNAGNGGNAGEVSLYDKRINVLEAIISSNGGDGGNGGGADNSGGGDDGGDGGVGGDGNNITFFYTSEVLNSTSTFSVDFGLGGNGGGGHTATGGVDGDDGTNGTSGTVNYIQLNNAPTILSNETIPNTPILNDDVYINITTNDTDGDEIIWVNFTVTNPKGVNYINNENGTRISSGIHEEWHSSNFTVNITGRYNWSFEISDNQSNVQSSDTFFFEVQPNPKITLNKPSGSFGDNESIPLNYTVEDNDGLDTCQYSLLNQTNTSQVISGNTTVGCTDGINNETIISVQQDTEFTLRFYANDTFGNSNSSDINFSTQTDNTPPTTTIVSPTGSFGSTQNIPLNHTTTDNLDNSLDTCQYWVEYTNSTIEIQNTTLQDCGNTTFNVDSEDDYVLYLWSNDTSANTNIENSSFSVDGNPPGVTIHNPENITYSESTLDLNVSSNESVDSWWYSLNGGSNIDFTPNTTITAQEGSNTIEVFANDTAGNIGSNSITFSVDTTPPNITIHEPQNQSYDDNDMDLNVSSSDSVDTWWYNLNDEGNTTFTPNTTFTATSGSNTIIIYANDSLGNEASEAIDFTISDFTDTITTTTSVLPAEEFGRTINLQSDVTVDNTKVTECNFTLSSPTQNLFTNETGVEITNTLWNSTSSVLVNETGTYNYSSTCTNDLGTTSTDSGSFESTYDLTISPSNFSFSAKEERNETRTISVNLFDSVDSEINYTITFDIESLNNFTIGNPGSIILNDEDSATNQFSFDLNITADNDIADGLYEGDITLTDDILGNSTVIPLVYGISPPAGSPDLYDSSDVECDDQFGSICSNDLDLDQGQSSSSSYIVKNTGNFSMSGCSAKFSGDFQDVDWLSTSLNDTFNLSRVNEDGSNQSFDVTFSPDTGVSPASYTGFFYIQCTDGDSLSSVVETEPSNRPLSQVVVSEDSGDGGSGGGGGGGGGTTIVESGSKQWRMQTTSGTSAYRIGLSQGQSASRDIEFYNTGREEVVVDIRCEGELCPYLTLEETQVTLPNQLEIATAVGFTIDIPEDLDDGSYSANIIGQDSEGDEAQVTVQANIGPVGFLISGFSRSFDFRIFDFGEGSQVPIPIILIMIIVGLGTFGLLYLVGARRGIPLAGNIIFSFILFLITPFFL